MAAKKTELTDEAISGPDILRFVNIPGFAQRRPKVEKEVKEHAANDITDNSGTADGDESPTDD